MELIDGRSLRGRRRGRRSRLRAGEADAYFQITDVTVLTATPRIIDLARERRLPLLIGDLNTLQDGVLAAYGVNYFEVGRFGPSMCSVCFRGAKPQDLPGGIYDKVARSESARPPGNWESLCRSR